MRVSVGYHVIFELIKVGFKHSYVEFHKKSIKDKFEQKLPIYFMPPGGVDGV